LFKSGRYSSLTKKKDKRMDLWGIHNKDDRFWWRFETIETRMSKAIFPWNKKFNNPSKKNVTDTFQNLNLHLMFRIWFASCYFYCSSLITHWLKMLRMVPLIFFSQAFQVGMVFVAVLIALIFPSFYLFYFTCPILHPVHISI